MVDGHHLETSDASSTFTNTTAETSTSLSTVPGLGYLSGKAFRRVGNVVVQGLDTIIIRRRLAQIEGALNRTGNMTAGGSLSPRSLYKDLLELCRLGYSQSVRRRAYRLVMGAIGGIEFENLAIAILDWHESELYELLGEIFVCFQRDDDSMLLPAYLADGMNAYKARLPYTVSWCTLLTPWMLFLALTISLSPNPTFARILIDLNIIGFVKRVYPFVDSTTQDRWPKTLVPVQLALRALLQKLEPMDDIVTVVELYSILRRGIGLSYTDNILVETRSTIAELGENSTSSLRVNRRDSKLPLRRRLPQNARSAVIETRSNHNQVEIELKRTRATEARNEIRVLVMGAATSSNAAALKKLIAVDYHMSETSFKARVFTTVVQTVLTILNLMPQTHFARVHLPILLSIPLPIHDAVLPQDVAHVVQRLWGDPDVKEHVRRAQHTQLYQFFIYIAGALNRISSGVYSPSYQDMIFCKNAAELCSLDSAVTEISWNADNLTYRFYHINHLQLSTSSLKGWINIFQNLTALIFLVNMSEYDAEGLNGMQEAIVTFDAIHNSKWFSKTPIILLMNEMDILARKLPYLPLSTFYPDYTGGSNFDAACKYLVQQFVKIEHTEAARQIYVRFDVNSANEVKFSQLLLSTMADILLDNDLRTSGLI